MRTNIQDKQKNRNQIISLVLLCLSIVIGFFFTMDQGYGYMEKRDSLDALKKEVDGKKTELEKLQASAKTIENDTELQNDISRYAGEFREDGILDSIFAPINGISIANITMTKGEKSPNGLSAATISLALKAQDTNALNNFLNYLTNSKTNKKAYIIKSLNFPLDTTKNEPVAASLELLMYYFE